MIQRLVRGGAYQLSSHVLDKIANNDFTQDDIEVSVLSGNIVKSQRDDQEVALDGKKHTICGRTRSGLVFQTVGKIFEGVDGNQYFFITAYMYR